MDAIDAPRGKRGFTHMVITRLDLYNQIAMHRFDIALLKDVVGLKNDGWIFPFLFFFFSQKM